MFISILFLFFVTGNPMTAVYSIPATRPGYTGYFISTPPSSYHSPSWMSYPPEPEDVPPQWAESVRMHLSYLFIGLLSVVQFCFKLGCIPRPQCYSACTTNTIYCGVNLMVCNQEKQNWSVTCASIHCSEFGEHSVWSCDLPLGARIVLLIPVCVCLHSHGVFLQNLCHLETICWTEFIADVEWKQQIPGVVEHISSNEHFFFSFFPVSQAGLCAIQNWINFKKINWIELK